MTSVTSASIAYVATQVSMFMPFFSLLIAPSCSGALRFELITGFFEDGLVHCFGVLLQFCDGPV
jgi:hypothetical protein